MIRYDLICDKGHEFDAWFSESAAYDQQRKRGFVACSHCGSSKVEKQIMAPNIGTKSNKRSHPSQSVMTPPADPRMQMMVQMVRELRKHVEQNAQDVGDNFAEEARKMHYKEAEQRGIYGRATTDDALALIEEGIDVLPLPQLPEDGH